LVNFRGHGGSSYNTKSISAKDYALDIALLCQQLKIIKGIFIGWSAGGGIAQQLAANFPSLVQGIVLISCAVTPFGAKILKK
jgi:3-oxoadipate enol-lactonase